MTLLTVARDVCAVVGVTAPTSVFANLNINRTMFEMLANANEMAQRIAYDLREWTAMRKTTMFNGPGFGLWASGVAYAIGTKVTDPANGSAWEVAVAHTSGFSVDGTFAADRAAHPTWWTSATYAAFALPADYRRMLLTSGVRSSTQPKQPLRFISDFDQWTERRFDANTTGSGGEWTIAGEQLLIAPPPRGPIIAVPADPTKDIPAVTIMFPYLDRNCVRLASGGFGDRFMADGDSFRLDERLLKLGMIANWKQQKGSPYGEDLGTYTDALAMAMGADKPGPIIVGRLPLSAHARVAYPWPGSWGPQ